MLYSKIDEYNLYLYHEGTNFYSYKIFGAHLIKNNNKDGVRFTVWAPRAKKVKVIGDFNCWDGRDHCMERINDSGVWSIFIPDIKSGERYKYEIVTTNNETLQKSDPYAFFSELRPKSASIVYPLINYKWNDREWLVKRKEKSIYNKPVLIYEIHLGSWKRKDNGNYFSFKDYVNELLDYVIDMGYTHIELLPVMEHPYDGSWGYQIIGYYSVTSRFGNPKDFMYFIDSCHEKGIGVILDWVPGHFCRDGHGLGKFDGYPVYENEDTLISENVGWGTINFDLGKPEVQSFLISNAVFWFDVFHIDGIRVDAVANLLYYPSELNVKNKYGGKENLVSIDFLKRLNKVVFEKYPGILMIAEDSTDWPLVTKPTYVGGLGYNYKWNMGWMNDMLKYMEMDPVYRKWHHNLLTFSLMYAFSENFILPLSHDEVVHGKKSLLNKIPGDYWKKFASLRMFYGYMMGHPGKKLLFMGGEFGQFSEWYEQVSLDWHLLDYPMHKKLLDYVKELNCFYKTYNELWEIDHSWQGFKWIDPHNYNQSITVFMRSNSNNDYIIIVSNFTPVVYENYRIGVPKEKNYKEIFNSDHTKYGGSGQLNSKLLKAQGIKWHNQPYSIELKIPPLATIFIKADETKSNDKKGVVRNG